MKRDPITLNIAVCQSSTKPDEQELDNLGPGCYVQVKEDQNCFWVEITSMEGDEFSAALHCELDGSSCQPAKIQQKDAKYHKSQIVNLGCDNYCWC